MRLSKYVLVLGMALALFTVAAPYVGHAQCPMCKMSAESNLQNGGSAGKGLNNGILYMLATPYLLIGAVGYVWYRNRRLKEEEELVFDEE